MLPLVNFKQLNLCQLIFSFSISSCYQVAQKSSWYLLLLDQFRQVLMYGIYLLKLELGSIRTEFRLLVQPCVKKYLGAVPARNDITNVVQVEGRTGSVPNVLKLLDKALLHFFDSESLLNLITCSLVFLWWEDSSSFSCISFLSIYSFVVSYKKKKKKFTKLAVTYKKKKKSLVNLLL